MSDASGSEATVRSHRSTVPRESVHVSSLPFPLWYQDMGPRCVSGGRSASTAARQSWVRRCPSAPLVRQLACRCLSSATNCSLGIPRRGRLPSRQLPDEAFLAESAVDAARHPLRVQVLAIALSNFSSPGARPLASTMTSFVSIRRPGWMIRLCSER